MWSQAKLDEGIAAFNSGKYFEAHEALEEVWRQMHGPERDLMQAVVQVAVALHHHSTGNLDGARSVLARAAAKLADAPDNFCGISLPPLRQALDRWQKALADGSSLPPVPRLQTGERC